MRLSTVKGTGAEARRVRVSFLLLESACFRRAESWRTVICQGIITNLFSTLFLSENTSSNKSSFTRATDLEAVFVSKSLQKPKTSISLYFLWLKEWQAFHFFFLEVTKEANSTQSVHKTLNGPVYYCPFSFFYKNVFESLLELLLSLVSFSLNVKIKQMKTPENRTA